MGPLTFSLDERLANAGDTWQLAGHLDEPGYSVGDHEFSTRGDRLCPGWTVLLAWRGALRRHGQRVLVATPGGDVELAHPQPHRRIAEQHHDDGKEFEGCPVQVDHTSTIISPVVGTDVNDRAETTLMVKLWVSLVYPDLDAVIVMSKSPASVGVPYTVLPLTCSQSAPETLIVHPETLVLTTYENAVPVEIVVSP